MTDKRMLRVTLTNVIRIIFIVFSICLVVFCVNFNEIMVEKEKAEQQALILEEQKKIEMMTSALNEFVQKYTGKGNEEIYIPSCTTIYFDISSKTNSFSYENPAQNSCYLCVSITRKDTSETIYTSTLISPGKKVEFPQFSSDFVHAGTYNAMVKVDAFSMDGFSFLNSIVMDTKIQAY